jgi:uncharacterized membrane protein (UPF0136 family)
VLAISALTAAVFTRAETTLNFTPWIILIYGLLVVAGGVMGFVKAKSKASLIAGVISGNLLAMASALMLTDNAQIGWWMALVTAILLLGRFAVASMKEFKMMPNGMVIGLSIIALVVLLLNRTMAGI